jgi:hypothetical protein
MEIQQQTRKSKGAYLSLAKSEKVIAVIRDGDGGGKAFGGRNVFEWWSPVFETSDDIFTRIYLTNAELTFLSKH